MSNSIRLYVDKQRLSPYAMSAFVALCEKGVEFEVLPVDLDAGEQHAGGYPQLSLTHRVPTLVHDGFALSESSAIAEYLDEVFTGPGRLPLYPTEPRVRARARQLQAWLRSDFLAIRQERTTDVVFRSPSRERLSAEAVAAAQRLFVALDVLLPLGDRNLFGSWSITDTDLALMLQRLLSCGDEVPARWAAYAQHQWRRPSVRQWVDFTRG